MKDTKDIWAWVTEAQISCEENGDTPMRELEKWIPECSEGDMVGLGETDDGNSNGWSVQEMFEKNKELVERKAQIAAEIAEIKKNIHVYSFIEDISAPSATNPNAKEFSLNPNAKKFTPRSPPSASQVAPTPPHLQTPHHPIIAGGVPGHQLMVQFPLPPVISMVMPVPGGPMGMIAGPGIVQNQCGRPLSALKHTAKYCGTQKALMNWNLRMKAVEHVIVILAHLSSYHY